MDEKEKIRYPSIHFRLREETVELLKKAKVRSGKSWNLFFFDLITNKYADETMRKMLRKRMEIPED